VRLFPLCRSSRKRTIAVKKSVLFLCDGRII
jgi:hypothetical protein